MATFSDAIISEILLSSKFRLNLEDFQTKVHPHR